MTPLHCLRLETLSTDLRYLGVMAGVEIREPELARHVGTTNTAALARVHFSQGNITQTFRQLRYSISVLLPYGNLHEHLD